MTRMPKSFAVVGAVLLSALALASCRMEEQDRPLIYKKGHYMGPQDDKLSDGTLATLRERTAEQSGSSLGGAGAVQTTGTDVRPPK